MQAKTVANCSNAEKFIEVYNEVMEITKVFGENLRVLREGLNLSADSFGEKIGITGKHVYDIEKGRKKPSMDVIEGIERKYHVAASDLFKREVAPVKRLPMSQSLQRALKIPDRIYELAERVDVGNDVWDAIEGLLEDEIEYGQKDKSKTKA